MMKHIRSVVSLKTDRRGVTALEYAIMAGLIVVAVVAALTPFKAGLSTAFANLSSTLNSQTSGSAGSGSGSGG